MYRHILVPLDGSELAEVVFPYVIDIAIKFNAKVSPFYVIDPGDSTPYTIHQAYISSASATIIKQVNEIKEKYDEEKAKTILVNVSGDLIEGYPADEILKKADAHKVDLIILATRGKSGVNRLALGSVTEKILRTSRVPVLLVRADHSTQIPYCKWPSRTLLVPLDGSELAESVLPHVETLIKQYATEHINIVLLHVFGPPITPEYFFKANVKPRSSKYVEQLTSLVKREYKEYLSKIEKQLKSFTTHVHSEILIGDAASMIVEHAYLNPFSIIIMATHGKAASSRWTSGSVTDKVLHASSNPILLIRSQ
jgi:nucleotide-binding universal stress UspA family protein